MRTLLKKYLGSALVQNLAVMFSGQSLALVIPFLLAPIITRLYTPEDFAGYELFARLLSLSVVISGLRYEYAIIIPKSDEEAVGILRLSMRILLIMSALSLVIFWPFRQWWADLFKNDALPELLWWLPPGLFISGVLTQAGYYLLRERKFRFLASNKMIAVGSNHGLKYLIGLQVPSAMGLVSAHVIGLLMPIAAFFSLTTFRGLLEKMKRNTMSLKSLMVKYKEFPTANAAHSLYHEGYQTVLFLVVSAYYGELILGLFAFTFRYLRIPVQVFGTSLSQVLMPDLAQDYNAGRPLRRKVTRALLLCTVVAILPFGALFFYGEPVFALFFGEKWAGAGAFAEIMAPWLFFNFISSPISPLPNIIRRQTTFFIYSALGTGLAVLAAFLMALRQYDFTEVLYIVVLISAVHNVLLMIWLVRIAPR